MRLHRDFIAYSGWLGSGLSSEMLRPDALAVVRCEPLVDAADPWLTADLTLVAGGAATCLAFVRVDVVALVRRSADPVVWPHAVAGTTSPADLGALGCALADVLRNLYSGGTTAGERIVILNDAARPAFEAARADGAAGAIPLAELRARWMPLLHAARFARDRRVVVTCPGGAHVAAALSAVTDRLAVDRGVLAGDSLRWYGLDPARPLPGSTYDVAIGTAACADEAPIVVRLSDDHRALLAVDGAIDRPARPLPALAAPVGGSSGRIALLLRPDAAAHPDADSDEAATLAAALSAEGFTAAVVVDAGEIESFAPDVLHIVGLERPDLALSALRAARARGALVAVSPLCDDPANEGWWGTAADAVRAAALDETERDLMDRLIAARTVAVHGIGAAQRTGFAPLATLRAAVLAEADVTLVHTLAEDERVKLLGGRRTRIVPPLVAAPAVPAPVGALVGPDPFVLVHAVVRREANLSPIARGAARRNFPLVIAGPVADPAEAERLTRMGGATTLLVPDPEAAVIAGLYASAAVYADVAWVGRGEYRVDLARRSGAIVVRDRRRGEGAGVITVDRADGANVGDRIGDAYLGFRPSDDTPREPSHVRTVLEAYAAATTVAR